MTPLVTPINLHLLYFWGKEWCRWGVDWGGWGGEPAEARALCFVRMKYCYCCYLACADLLPTTARPVLLAALPLLLLLLLPSL